MKKYHVIAGLIAAALLSVSLVVPGLAGAAPNFANYEWTQISPASGTDPGTGSGEFNTNYGVVLDSQGRVFASDSMNDRIQILSTSGTYQDSIDLSANSQPRGMAFGPNGHLFVACFGTNEIDEYDVGAKELVASYEDTDMLNGPSGVAVDHEGAIYVTNAAGSHAGIVKFPADGGAAFRIATDDSAHVVAVGSGLTLAPNGDIYVAASTSGQVYAFDTDGNYIKSFGTPGSGYPGVPLDDGVLYNPRGVAVDADGYVYAADTDNCRIQVFDPSGDFVYGWGTSKTPGSDVGEFSYPNGITFDSTGNLYVADTVNNRVQKASPAAVPVETYTVSFDTNGGSPTPKDQTVPSGDLVDKPTDPTRDGYTFNGWYTDPQCTQAWEFDTDTVQGDMTLYAGWTEDTPAPPVPVTPSTNPTSSVTPTSTGGPGSGGTAYYDSASNGPKTGDDLPMVALLVTLLAAGLVTTTAWVKGRNVLRR